MSVATVYVFSSYDCCCGGGFGASGPVAAFADPDHAEKYGKVHTDLDMTEIEISGDPGEIATQYIAKSVFTKRPRMVGNGACWDRKDEDSTKLVFGTPEIKAIASASGPTARVQSWSVTVTALDKDTADRERERQITLWRERRDAKAVRE